MDASEVKIRVAEPQDATALRAIYKPYVEKTVITFEYAVPTVEEFSERISKTLQRYPYLVAEYKGAILGYAYTGPFVGRAAYDWGVETSIYLDENNKKMGLGKRLYAALEKISQAQHILNMNACIGYPQVEDEYLTKNSVEFHAHLGFRMVGIFHQCGYKFKRWYDMAWMEKIIGEHTADVLPVLSFADIQIDKLDL